LPTDPTDFDRFAFVLPVFLWNWELAELGMKNKVKIRKP